MGCKNASRVPTHFSFHLYQLLNLGWSAISCFSSCFTAEFNGLGLNSCLQRQIAPPLIERRVQNLLNQIPSLNSPSLFLTLEQKSLACRCLCLPWFTHQPPHTGWFHIVPTRASVTPCARGCASGWAGTSEWSRCLHRFNTGFLDWHTTANICLCL